MDLITNPTNKFWLQIFGSMMLLVFGIYCFRNNPTKKMHHSGNNKGTFWHNGLTAFLVTFSNPLIIFIFMASLPLSFPTIISRCPLATPALWEVRCCGGMD